MHFFLSFRKNSHRLIMRFEGNTWPTYVIFSFIALVAFLGNSLVLYVLVTRPQYLRQPYSVCILNLAATDCLTAIFLIVSRFLYLPPTPKNVIAGEVFCRTMWSSWILFSLGYVSIYMCLVLTIERWFAVVKPLLYISIQPWHVKIVLSFVWLWGPAVNVTTLFRVKFIVAEQRCTWVPLNVANSMLPWMDFKLQSIVPFAAMIVLYTHLLHVMKGLPNQSSHRFLLIRKITNTALVASSAIVVCWLPGRISFMLSKFNLTDPDGIPHYCLIILTFLNSCVNPLLYGIYGSVFRKEYTKIFKKLLAVCSCESWRPRPKSGSSTLRLDGRTMSSGFPIS